MKHKKSLRYQNLLLIAYFVLVVGCSVVLTLVAEKIELQFHLRWDVTSDQIYSIGDKSKQVLQKLDKNLTIYTLYESGSEDRTISEILKKYKGESKHIKLENIDPVENPLFSQQFETEDEQLEKSSLIIQVDDTKDFRVIKAQDMYEWQLQEDQLYASGMVAEQRITAAIASLEGAKQNTAYFVTGHGEMDVTKQYYLAKTLESDGYTVEPYDLIYNDTELTSDDCLLFLAPLQDLTTEEYYFFQKFMQSGGKAVCLINPLAGELPNFNQLFDLYGLKLNNDMIVEFDSNHYLNSPIMIKPDMNENNPVLKSVIEADAGLVLPNCRGISSIENPDVELDAILNSSKSSYGKVDPYTKTLDKEDGDTTGAFLLGVTANSKETGSRLVLIGSSDFISTLENAKYEGNIALFMDSVAWAAQKEDSVVIKPKSLVSAPLQIQSAAQGYRLMILVIAVIPVTILMIGMFVWRRRLSR